MGFLDSSKCIYHMAIWHQKFRFFNISNGDLHPFFYLWVEGLVTSIYQIKHMILIVLPKFFRFLLPKFVTAITLWPFVVFRKAEKMSDFRIINHEKIHFRQQIELLVIPFYLIYILEFLFLLILKRNWDSAYRSISFEKEAYLFEKDFGYLKGRKFFAMWRSVKKA